MSEPAETCRDCRFFEELAPRMLGRGACRRLPPVRTESKNDQYSLEHSYYDQPRTNNYDWCGEFKARSDG